MTQPPDTAAAEKLAQEVASRSGPDIFGYHNMAKALLASIDRADKAEENARDASSDEDRAIVDGNKTLWERNSLSDQCEDQQGTISELRAENCTLKQKLSRTESQLTAANERADRATAEAAVLRTALANAGGLICESGNLNNYRNLSDQELGKVWIETAKFVADTLTSNTAGADFLARHRELVSEHRRLVEGQRTKGLDEKCQHCGVEFETGFDGCKMYEDDESGQLCPAIRSGVKP